MTENGGHECDWTATRPHTRIHTYARAHTHSLLTRPPDQIEEDRKREIAELLLIKAAKAKRNVRHGGAPSSPKRALSRSLSPRHAAAAARHKKGSVAASPALSQPSRQLAMPTTSDLPGAAGITLAADEMEISALLGADVAAAAAGVSSAAAASVTNVQSAQDEEFEQLLEDAKNRKEQEVLNYLGKHTRAHAQTHAHTRTRTCTPTHVYTYALFLSVHTQSQM